jgi:signal transduction histidine kinase
VTEVGDFRTRIVRLQEQLREWFSDDLSDGETVEDLSAVLGELEAATGELLARSEELRASRENIQRERERWYQLFESAPDPCLVTDDAGFILEANREARRLFAPSSWALRSPLVAHISSDSRLPYLRLLRMPPATVDPPPVIVRLRTASVSEFRGELRRGRIGANEYLWLMRDVTVMEEARQRLEEAVDQERRVSKQLKDFDELRNAFLLAVSHDLQAPLAAIAALAELLRADRLDDGQRRSVIGRLEEAATSTTHLLDDLLDYQRITYGSRPITRHAVALDRLVRDAVGRVAAGGHPIQLDLDPVTIEVDPGLAERIVTNLFTNAIQHTPPGTTVWVRCRREPDGALLAVEDDGPGVPPERRASVFELFEHDPDSPGTGRLGVGLALVARFAELHGGYARVEERLGGGAAFHVLLPEDDSS